MIKRVVLRNGIRALIRPQTLEDTDGLWKLYSSLSTKTRMLTGIPEQMKEGEFRQRMKEVLQDGKRNRYVCVALHPNEEFIGYFGIYTGENDTQKGWIFFFVQDAYQRKGLGWMILKHIVEEAPSLGLKTLGARVYSENKRATRLLKRYNFEVQKESIDPESNKRSYMMNREIIAYSFKTIDVQGIRYRVVKESEIKNYLFETLRAEWEEKEFNVEWYPEMDHWNWSVETFDVSDVRLWKPLMKDPTFISDLKRRSGALRELILQEEIIEPIVVRGRYMVIYDGYARLHTLKQLGKSKILAYVGHDSRRT